MIEVFLVRHAESEGNLRPDLVSGQSNHYPLSPLGQQQAQQLAARFVAQGLHFDKIACSPAVRTQETLRPVCTALGVEWAQVQITPQLLELDQGEWVGRVRAEVYTAAVRAQINADNWNFKAPGGESQREVEERMWGWLQTDVVHAFARPAKVLVVGHGVAIKCLLRRILDSSPAMTYKIRTDNTSINKIAWQADRGWSIEAINDTAHLVCPLLQL